MKRIFFSSENKIAFNNTKTTLVKISFVGFILTLLFFDFNSKSFAQKNKESESQKFARLERQDVKSEISVIFGIETAISKVLKKNSPKIGSQKSAEILRKALEKFYGFQRGNGGKYVLGDPGNIFHRMRNNASGIDSLITTNLDGKGKEEVSVGTLNALTLYQKCLSHERNLLNDYLKVGYTVDSKSGC